MNTILAMRVVLFAGELLAASSLIVALAWLASFRDSASRRHLVWVGAFGTLVLLPVLAVLVPGSIVLSLPAPTVVPVAVDMSAVTISAPAPQAFHFGLEDAATALIALWLAGIALFALRSLIAAIVLRALRRDSADNPFDPSELPELASGRAYDLRVSHAERGPVTWGIFRPVILLPNKALFWPGERLHAVLKHELAHIHRHDSLAQMLSLAACALYWPNPLVWLGARALRREAEMAADDAVIVSGMTPSEYAGELLQVAVEFRAQDLAAASPLFMAAPSAFEARLKSVLAPTQQRSGVTSMDVLKISGLALLATTALVLARPSLAQDAPQAPAAPAAMAAPPSPPAPPSDATVPVAPTAPDDAVSADKPVHRFHTREVRRFTDRDGHHHVEIVERDGDNAQALADVAPEIDRAMAEVKAHEAEIRAVQPQIEKAFAEARAEIAKVSDEKIRAQVDAALAHAQAELEAAHMRMEEHHHVVIERDEDHGQDAPDGK